MSETILNITTKTESKHLNMKVTSGLYLSIIILIVTLSISCSTGSSSIKESTEISSDTLENNVVTNQTGKETSSSPQRVPADAVTILSRKQVPVLCYHQ